MVKKISAVVLAIVLCLSVIVVPVSAAKVELGDAQISFALEWDKASYSAGETATLSVYMTAAEDVPLGTGSFAIGLNSNVISPDDNDVKANSESSDLLTSFWKPASDQSTWLAQKAVDAVIATNTEEENALYDQYVKFVASRDTNGSHYNAKNNKSGFYGSDFNTDEPIMTFSFVIADVPDGTELNAAITSGTLTSKPAQTAWKYYSNPDNATTTANATIDLSQAVATATVGDVAPAIVEFSKAQIRFHGVGTDGNFDNYVDKKFDVRTVAKITEANFISTFESEDNAKAKITDLGFVYAAKSEVADFSDDIAMKVAKGEEVEGAEKYTKANVTYMQHKDGEYIFTCLITDIDDADKTDGVNCMAFVKYDNEYYFFNASETVEYSALYTQYGPKD